MNLMNKFMKQQIWNGEYSPDKPSHMATVQRHFDGAVRQRGKGPTDLATRIRECRKNLERIQAVAEFYTWIPPDPTELAKYKKSDDLAAKFRQLGNEFYRHRKFPEALHAYNLGIVFAASTQNSELALVFANRSAVFYECSYPTLALRDARAAEELGYPKELLPKLEQRKEKCLKQLDTIKITNETETPTPDDLYLTDEMRRRKEHSSQNLFSLPYDQISPQIPTARSCVEITESEERGRHVVVTENVPVGTVVIVDRPFAKILLKEVCWDVQHCHHCHRPLANGIPCTKCVFGFYCDEICREAAWRLCHLYECACALYLYSLKAPRTALLAFRIVCQMGAVALHQLWTTNKDLTHQESDPASRLKGFHNGVYDSSLYWPIAQLISHPDKLEPSEVVSYCLTALTLVSVLDEKTDFFTLKLDNGSAGDMGEFKLFVASVILLHMQNLPPNAHSINELTLPPTVTLPGREETLSQMQAREIIRNAQVEEYGVGAFALLSLINHSCAPNVFRVNWWDGRTAVVALQTLRAGEELQDNYGAHFAVMDQESRQDHLRTNYYFKCGCLACADGWPIYDGLKDRAEEFLCPACPDSSSVLDIDTSVSAFACRRCPGRFDATTLNRSLNMKMDQFLMAYGSVVDNNPLAALDSLRDVLMYLDRTVRPPFSRTCDAQETFKQALNLVAHFACFRFSC